MNIGIIGAGNVGGALGQAFLAQGHALMYGLRDANSPKARKALSELGLKVKVGTPAEAAAFGDVIMLTVTWPGVREVVPALGDLGGRILVDTTNRFDPQPGDGPSAAEDIARMAAGARVVKAFNTMASATMVDPLFGGQTASAFICGDDADAKATVLELIKEIGLEGVDAGPLANAALLEGMAHLWVYLAYTAGMGTDFAFKLIWR